MTDRFKKISPHLLENEPMSAHTTFRIGGPADMFVSVRSISEVRELIKAAKETMTPFMVIGNGSNMLVSDKGIRGLVIHIGKDLSDISVSGNIITAQAGALMSKVASEALRAELTGFETLSGIPGSLGGGPFMNAGAYGGEIKNVVKSVTYIDESGEIYTVSNEECKFSYRHSIFCDGGKYILSAELELKKGDPSEIKAAMDDYNNRRKEKQPLSMPSAGSTFKRPEGYFAGRLIEDCGLKGYRVGGAMISDLHAGFVVNTGNATASDVMTLIDDVRDMVRKKFGVELEPEVRLIGER